MKDVLKWLNKVLISSWLFPLLKLLIKPNVSPKDPKNFGFGDQGEAVCYMLETQSLTDYLALSIACKQFGIKKPSSSIRNIMEYGSSYIYLVKMGIFRHVRKNAKQPPSKLVNIIQLVESNPKKNILLVPVTAVWGRVPKQKNRRFLNTFFSEDDRGAKIQKFFIMLFHGRDVRLHFGKPISLRNQLQENLGVEETSKKIRRVLRVHYLRKRQSILGPLSMSREYIYKRISRDPFLQKTLGEEVRSGRKTKEELDSAIKKCFYEISANRKYTTIRAAEFIFGKMWNSLFKEIKIFGEKELVQLGVNHELIYVPCHRSHLDYMLNGYVIQKAGLPVPHIAAGANLNFWPVGGLIRKVGAFYIRRKFSGDKVYTTTFRSYLMFLINQGFSFLFYAEGGRSRTGRLLQPKTGLLSMVIQSYLKDSSKPIAFIPTYIGYDKVMEIKSYVKENRGEKKKKESFSELLKLRKIFKVNLGRNYMSFGQPIFLEKELSKSVDNWQEQTGDIKPEWLIPFTQDFSNQIMCGIASASVANPVSLYATVMLSKNQRAFEEHQLECILAVMIKMLRFDPISDRMVIPIDDPKEILKDVETHGYLRRMTEESSDVIFIDEIDQVYLSYYANNTKHLYAIPSLVARYFVNNDAIREEFLIEQCLRFYPFLAADLFLPWSDEEAKNKITNMIEFFVNNGFLVREVRNEKVVLVRPDLSSEEFLYLNIIGQLLGNLYERGAIMIALLAANHGRPLDREAFDTRSKKLTKRIAMLMGLPERGVKDKKFTTVFLRVAKKYSYIKPDEDSILTVDESIQHLVVGSSFLLPSDVLQSMKRMALEKDIPLVGQEVKRL